MYIYIYIYIYIYYGFHVLQCQLGIKIISWGLLNFLKDGLRSFHVAFDAPTLLLHQTTLTSINPFAMLTDIRPSVS